MIVKVLFLRLVALGLPGHLSEMQNLKFSHRPTESESAFNVIVMTVKLIF